MLVLTLDDVNNLFYEDEVSETLYSLLRSHEAFSGAKIDVIVNLYRGKNTKLRSGKVCLDQRISLLLSTSFTSSDFKTSATDTTYFYSYLPIMELSDLAYNCKAQT